MDQIWSETTIFLQGRELGLPGTAAMSVPSASRGANLLMGHKVPSVQISLRLLIPNASAGSVIGRNGDTINRIRDLTGATIKVHREHPGRQLCWLLLSLASGHGHSGNAAARYTCLGRQQFAVLQMPVSVCIAD